MNDQTDQLKQALIRMIQHIRDNPDKNIELEVRVGQFTSENNFKAGYSHEHLKLIYRMLQRLTKNTKHEELKKTWTKEPEYMMMRCEYPDDLRKTCRPPFPEEYMIKKKYEKIDVLTDRQYHLRFSLSDEQKNDITKNPTLYESIKQNPPTSVRYIYKHCFQEIVPACTDIKDAKDTGNTKDAKDTKEETIIFHWEISKVSDPAPNKKKSTETPCTYHCELELKTKLLPIQNETEAMLKNTLLADLILSRAKALLGTTYIVVLQPPKPTGSTANPTALQTTWKPLPLPKLNILV